MDRSDMMYVMYDKKGPKVAENFAKRGFEAYYCPTKKKRCKKRWPSFRQTTSCPGAVPFLSTKSACGPMCWSTTRSSTATPPARRKNESS